VLVVTELVSGSTGPLSDALADAEAPLVSPALPELSCVESSCAIFDPPHEPSSKLETTQ
jgi:hypothetical protein